MKKQIEFEQHDFKHKQDSLSLKKMVTAVMSTFP